MGFFNLFKRKKNEDLDFSNFKGFQNENSSFSFTDNNASTSFYSSFENQNNLDNFQNQSIQSSSQNTFSSTEMMQEKQFQQAIAYNNFSSQNYESLKRDLELIIEKINTLKAMIDATDIRLRKIEEMLESHRDQRRYY